MGNQCCSGSPCESNQVVTTTATHQKFIEPEMPSKRKVEHVNEKISEENTFDQPFEKPFNNTFLQNQDEHYPSKNIAQEVSSQPEIDNQGPFFSLTLFEFLNSGFTNISKVRPFYLL